MTTISARDFNRDVSAAKRAADAGPVIITDRGVPAYVLLKYDAFAARANTSLAEALSMSEEDYFDFDFEVDRSDDLPREVAW